jgi:hypothetical protein
VSGESGFTLFIKTIRRQHQGGNVLGKEGKKRGNGE